jgi:hypothetical protein
MSKKEKIRKLKPNQYRIYGIFDFDKEDLIYINLNLEHTELEFDMSNYEEERYGIVEFKVILV